MDIITKEFAWQELDEDLNWCPMLEIAWQKNMRDTIEYADEYWANYVKREHTPIAIKLNNFRCSLVEQYCDVILDIGIGCGEFLKKIRLKGYGYDINHIAVAWLKERDIFCDPYKEIPVSINGITLWDVIEHVPNPEVLFSAIPKDCYVFISTPVVESIQEVKKSKHYKPKEHLIYATRKGILNLLKLLNCEFLLRMNNETVIGRDNILTFVCKKL